MRIAERKFGMLCNYKTETTHAGKTYLKVNNV